VAKIALERRNNRRYDVRLPIHYRISQRGGLPRVGLASTCEISTEGLSFRTRKPLPVGAHVEMVIDWPVRYGETYPIDLQCTGFIIRSENGRTAVRVTSRKFRVLGAPEEAIPVSA
jgi:hypothetical protein